MKTRISFFNAGMNLKFFLFVLLWMCAIVPCRADLDEKGFEFYTSGEINNQQGLSWEIQSSDLSSTTDC